MTSDSAVQRGLKDVMRAFPQGVTVVTTSSPEGPKGITVSAFISVSLVPPLVLVSISKTSAVHDLFIRSKGFAVNFLSEDQKSVSERFAGKQEAADKLEGVGFRAGATGSPLIPGARAVVECNRWRVYDGGDHSLLIGQVAIAEKLSDKAPLVYHDQQYTTIEQPGRASPAEETTWRPGSSRVK